MTTLTVATDVHDPTAQFHLLAYDADGTEFVVTCALQHDLHGYFGRVVTYDIPRDSALASYHLCPLPYVEIDGGDYVATIPTFHPQCVAAVTFRKVTRRYTRPGSV
jgi:hypothetical protein